MLFLDPLNGFYDPPMGGRYPAETRVNRARVMRGGDLQAPAAASGFCPLSVGADTRQKWAQQGHLSWEALGHAFRTMRDRIFPVTQDPGLKLHRQPSVDFQRFVFFFYLCDLVNS